MGFRTVSRILQWPLKSSPKFVLVLLATHENDNTKRCDPSVIRLATESGLNRKTIIRSLHILESIGAVVAAKTWGRRSSYTIPETFPASGTGPTTPPVAPRDQSRDATGLVPPWDGTGPTMPPYQEVSKSRKLRRPKIFVGPVFTDQAGTPWQMTPGTMSKLVDMFPNVDMDKTLAAAADHCERNPQWRRKASGMLGAIQAWCGREWPKESLATPAEGIRVFTIEQGLAIMGDSNAP